MDVKSMSKSKRSHTQHNQPRKPHHPSSNSATSKDKKKSTQPPPPSLPSNWDRYEDEMEQVPSQLTDSSGKTRVDFDVVKPKSKGADFSSLIAQAKESRSYYSPSFDDKLPEFYQGAAPMLAARGEKLILQDRDDDFLMEDKGIDTQEAPFLTLDLERLAERLSKVDLAKRLFIEQDLLPPELHDQDASEADNQAPFWTPERRNIKRIDSFGELLALYLEEERMAKRQDDADNDGMSFSANVSSCHDPESESKTDVAVSESNDLGFFDAREIVSDVNDIDLKSKFDDVGQVNHATKQVAMSKLEDLKYLDEREKPEVSHVAEQDTRPLSNFEAASAEAELDMLLGSFNETELFNTPLNQPRTSASYITGNISTHGAPLQQSLGRSAPAYPINSSLDSELDDLLGETSNSSKTDGLFQSTQVPSSSISQPGSKSKVLEDFDSWLDTL